MTQLLVDLGGTRCRVGLADTAGLHHATCRTYSNADFDGLTTLLRRYLDDTQAGPINALCAGVAGLVRGTTAQLTNLDWFIDATDLAGATGAHHVHLLNDLQAQAYALDDLPQGAVTNIFSGTVDPNGPRLVLGLGTGANIAVAHRIGNTLFVPPSESGHTTLPDAPGFRALYDALRRDAPHLPLESALSGPGLARFHTHLTGDMLSPAQIIDAQPRKTLQTFVSLLGLAASNMCLVHMATGGLFLIGGTARAIAPFLAPMGFTDTFHPRGPYSPILQDIPVSLVTDDATALAGCARYLRQVLSK